jgi:peptide/nickel transport system substrate-binding protein
MDGKAVRVATMLPSMHFGYDASLKPIKQDVAKSKKLGRRRLPNGVEIMLNGPQGRYVRDKEVAEAVAGQLNKAGIKTTLRTYEFVNYLNNMVYVHKAGPVWLIGWAILAGRRGFTPLFKAPNIFVNWSTRTSTGWWRTRSRDGREEAPGSNRINKLWIEEVPAILLYQQIDLYGANKRLAWKARSDELISRLRHGAQGRQVTARTALARSREAA